MTDIAVAANGVSKRFLSHTERATSLKERIVRRRSGATAEFWALRDVDVDVKQGETVGLMGANGSGKSTLLKIMAGILRPTEGSVTSSGRIASLLELGAGFNGELSGRDNVYLNASLLGLTRKETDGLFDQIVDFSELGQFIDAPVKHYSSGMYVRLGFAVAVHVDPDILLVDEVLAVGDEHFQRKCLDKISEFQDEGRTILFVSHSSALVERVCSRGVVLDHGRTVFDGDPYFAAHELSHLLGTDMPSTKGDLVVEGADLDFRGATFSTRPGGEPVTVVEGGGPLTISVRVNVGEHWVGQVDSVRLVMMGVGDIPIWVMTATRDQLPTRAGEWLMHFVVPATPLLRGRFVVATQFSRESGEAIASWRTQTALEVTGSQLAGIVRVDYGVRSEIEALA